jgi:predicted nucleic acid-binding protein
MGVDLALGCNHVFLDTCIFIYFIEEDSRYIKSVSKIFQSISDGHLTAVTSGITLLETLVVPLRVNDKTIAKRYEQFLCNSKGLTMVNLDRDLLKYASYLRAHFNVKTPDALQMAAAQQQNCNVFLTNDRRLPSISGLQVTQLSTLLQ